MISLTLRGKLTFHDETIKDAIELKQRHDLYGQSSNTVEVSLKMRLEILKEVERCVFAMG